MGLELCTAEAKLMDKFTLDGTRVILINTPGFDNSSKNDVDILEMTGAFLPTMYALAGVCHFSIFPAKLLDRQERDRSHPGISTYLQSVECKGRASEGRIPRRSFVCILLFLINIYVHLQDSARHVYVKVVLHGKTEGQFLEDMGAHHMETMGQVSKLSGFW